MSVHIGYIRLVHVMQHFFCRCLIRLGQVVKKVKHKSGLSLEKDFVGLVILDVGHPGILLIFFNILTITCILFTCIFTCPYYGSIYVTVIMLSLK